VSSLASQGVVGIAYLAPHTLASCRFRTFFPEQIYQR